MDIISFQLYILYGLLIIASILMFFVWRKYKWFLKRDCFQSLFSIPPSLLILSRASKGQWISQNFRKTRIAKKASEYAEYLCELFSQAESKILKKGKIWGLEAVPKKKMEK